MNFDGLKKIEEKKEKFGEFKNLLLEYNEKYNLTAICDEKGVYLKHFYDSLSAEELIFKGAKVVEIGSGAGFPSIPLKIVREDLDFTLIESTGKKCEFLRTVVEKLGLDGVQVLNIRAEDGGRNGLYREKFDCAVARAVAKLNILCEYCLPFVKVGGKMIAYKGDGENIDESLSAVKILGGELENVIEYELPENTGARRLVVIKKVSATPLKYPRGNGRERKKPL